MTIDAYIAMVNAAHQAQGAISGQRDVLSTTTAKRIRTRMLEDIRKGAVLPPVVIGYVEPSSTFRDLDKTIDPAWQTPIGKSKPEDLSIIDGMQRTAALIEARNGFEELGTRVIRVEFWIAQNVRALIYRMLVLNTGQVPWTMSRQLSVVYASLIGEIRTRVPSIDKLITPDVPGRRVRGAQYSSDAVIELYLAFGIRKTVVDTKEAVSDEFSRLDVVENLSDDDYQDQFYAALDLLAQLDNAFSGYETNAEGRMTKGRNIFDSQPARIGFTVAVGMYVLGRPGSDRPAEERAGRMRELSQSIKELVEKLQTMQSAELGDYLRLDVLREVLDRRVGQVGRYERAVYADAFKVLVEEHTYLNNLEPCWRAA
ncbi:hypothetical protein [Curtobacterium sp. 8I-2]|uniref:hypothetical protein n=1 Tax=Curtobacterium sp. 8I-2 TaxID=2653136 RepID=UPI001915A265|nr:hypothetical protein [Curtobacterium sp. 8I-2]